MNVTLGLFVLLMVLAAKIYRDLRTPNFESMTELQIQTFEECAKLWEVTRPEFAELMRAWPWMTRYEVLRVKLIIYRGILRSKINRIWCRIA